MPKSKRTNQEAATGLDRAAESIALRQEEWP